MLGYDYQLSLNAGSISKDSSILVVSNDIVFFLNYYFLPRRIYKYADITKDADLKNVSREKLKKDKINYILLYHPPSVKIINVDVNGSIK
jgi:hypothetical protein